MPDKDERTQFETEIANQKEGVCEIGLRNLTRATKRKAATLTIEAPDAFVEQLIRQAMRQPIQKRITHVWLKWKVEQQST